MIDSSVPLIEIPSAPSSFSNVINEVNSGTVSARVLYADSVDDQVETLERV